MIRLAAAVLVLSSGVAGAREPKGLDVALSRLAAEGRFSGAVVIRGEDRILFARGYGLADPFAGRAFTPDTPVDSGSLAKPVTAAMILSLVKAGRIDLDRPARTYLPDFANPDITVRQLLSHSAGLSFENDAAGLAGKSNARITAEAGARPLLFRPGSAFTYCNACTIVLAEIVERVSGKTYLANARERTGLPPGVALRPARLADWTGRAIGYRRGADGKPERFDSWEGELFYGPANLSISASQLAEWGSQWLGARLQSLRPAATAPARIGTSRSALSLGNWYCSDDKIQCHYLGHHEGFHHMLYWDSRRRISVAMVSNNALAPALQQPLQRAIVAYASGRSAVGDAELRRPLALQQLAPGTYRFPAGASVTIAQGDATARVGGVTYPAYPIGAGAAYVPGLDAYLSGEGGKAMRLLGLYRDWRGTRVPDAD